MSYSVTCSDCRAVLKSAKPIPAGTVLTCPKCGVMFPAPAMKANPAVKPAPVKAVAPATVSSPPTDPDIIEDVEVIDDGPAHGEPPVKKKKKKKANFKEKSKFNPKVVIAIVAGVLGVAGLVVGGIFLVKFLLADASDPLLYVADEPAVIGGADLGKLMSHPKVGAFIELGFNNLPQINKYRQDTKADMRSLIGKVVVAIPDKPFEQGVPFSVAIATQPKTTFDKAKLAAAFDLETASVGGRSGYKPKMLPGGQAGGVYFPSNRIIALAGGKPNEMDDIIRRGGKAGPKAHAKDIVEKASQGDIWFVVDMKAANISNAVQNNPAMPQAQQEILGQTRCVGVWVNLNGDDIEINSLTRMSNAEYAQKAIDESKKQGDLLKNPLFAGAMGMLGGGGNALKELADSSTYKQDGDLVVYSAKIKLNSIMSMIEALNKSQMPGLPGAMPGGPGGRPGGPAGRPGGRG